MSCNSADLPSSFDRFRAVWDIDFEFRHDENHRPVPVSLFAKEHRTGAEIAMWRDELLRTTRLPFDDGNDTLVTAYMAVAELNCLDRLNWPPPRNLLCTYVETSAAINGLDIVGLSEKRPSLLEACELFGVPHVSKEYKAAMRDLILSKAEYTDEEQRQINLYNRGDVEEDMPLLKAIAPTIDLPAALFRGRYLKAVSAMELRGIPTDTDYLRQLEANWQALRQYYIGRDDTFGCTMTMDRSAKFASKN